MAPTRRTFLQTALLATTARARAQTFPDEKPLFLSATAVSAGPKHHWFGYYDKCPWDRTGRYILAMESAFCDRQPNNRDSITVGYVDTFKGNRFVPLDTTLAWCWQQGPMLQWIGDEVIYNTVKDNQYVAKIRGLRPNAMTRTLPLPVYAVSRDGRQAVTLDFARLHRLRPGYGYAAIPENHAGEPAPKEIGIWHMDVESGKVELIISLAQLAANKPDDRFPNAEHWVNHLQFNPSGTRFVFLHRWKPKNKGWMTRIYTAKPDGGDLKLLHDSGMVSHFDWRDDSTILAWTRLNRNDRQPVFALLDVGGKLPEVVFPTEKVDGHCSYSPDRKWVLNDTYPDRERNQHLMLLDVKSGRRHSLNKFYSPKQFTGPVRCDLHPRWNRDGTKVCFDGCHGEQRQLYVVDVKDVVKA